MHGIRKRACPARPEVSGMDQVRAAAVSNSPFMASNFIVCIKFRVIYSASVQYGRGLSGREGESQMHEV